MEKLEDWCPPTDRRDYRNLVKQVGGDKAREVIEARIARRETLRRAI